MDLKDTKKSYKAFTGTTREERFWEKESQLEGIFKDLEMYKDEIEEIDLSNNSISINVSKQIAERINNLKNLKVVGFNDVFVSRSKEEIPKSLRLFIDALEGKQISVLNLSDNAFGPAGVSAFDFYLKTTKYLKELILMNNGLGPEGSSSVAEALKSNPNICLERIRVGRNRLESKGATAFGSFFSTQTSLIEVVTFQNGIKEDGMINLLNGLANNKNIEILKINDNSIVGKAADELIKLLKDLTKLRCLDISDSKLGSENSLKVMNILINIDSLNEFYCNYNEIEDKESQNEICNILTKKKYPFNKFEIKGNEIKKNIFKKIKTHPITENADVYSESEMDPDELLDLMDSLKIDN